ncbi:MAG TPA: hypothetical protein VFM05_12085, partial [Candidatus Saccharimonadales bacterium]|nr:hypothetical protein [Candidatus Saccharimonadales bacterium]
MKRFLIYVPYVLVTAAIMLPLLPPGYILTLDLVFTPSLRMPSEIGSDYLWYALLHFLDVILPSQLIEKVILVSIPLLASVGMHRLLVHVPMGASLTSRRLNRSGAGKQSFETTDSKVGSPLVSGLREVSEAPSKQWVLAIYAASIFYAVNPFTYSRFMAGQYAVLLGYALLPFFALALIRFLTAPSYLHTLKLTGLALVISIISIHTLGDLLLITVVALGVAIWQHKKGTG